MIMREEPQVESCTFEEEPLTDREFGAQGEMPLGAPDCAIACGTDNATNNAAVAKSFFIGSALIGEQGYALLGSTLMSVAYSPLGPLTAVKLTAVPSLRATMPDLRSSLT